MIRVRHAGVKDVGADVTQRELIYEIGEMLERDLLAEERARREQARQAARQVK